MGWGLRKKHKPKLTGIRPGRSSPVEDRQLHKTTCPQCGASVLYYQRPNEQPVRIVNCEDCKITFNLETGEILMQPRSET